MPRYTTRNRSPRSQLHMHFPTPAGVYHPLEMAVCQLDVVVVMQMIENSPQSTQTPALFQRLLRLVPTQSRGQDPCCKLLSEYLDARYTECLLRPNETVSVTWAANVLVNLARRYRSCGDSSV